jgi:hypothetical protein
MQTDNHLIHRSGVTCTPEQLPNKLRRARLSQISPDRKFDAAEKPEQHPMPKECSVSTGLLSEQIARR